MYGQISTLAFIGIEARPVEVQVRVTPGGCSVRHRRPARQGGRRKPRARPQRTARCRARPALQAHHGQSGARRSAEGRQPFRSADRAGDDVGDGSHRARRDRGLRSHRRAGARRFDPRRAGHAAGRHRRQRHGQGPHLPAGLRVPKRRGPSEDIDILAAPHLLSLVNHFKGMQTLSRPEAEHPAGRSLSLPDLRDIKGQETAKRALEIAAAGGHNLLMIGPPGSGKSMLAARLPSILPPLSPEEMLEVSMVHSLAGELMGGKLTVERPFRAPHHSASMAALVGGGSRPRPGEVSLAHHRRAVSRRAARVPAERARRTAPAAGVGRDGHRARQPSHFLSVAHPARRGDEPVQMRRRRRRASVPPRSALRRRLPGAHLRARCSIASICRSRCRRSQPPISSAAAGRGQRRGPRACDGGARSSAGAFCGARRQGCPNECRVLGSAARADVDAR